MLNMPLLQNQMKKAKSYVYTIGQILNEACGKVRSNRNAH